MARVLVVYGSSHGHTAKVVERIARGLIARGHPVTVWKGDELPAGRSLDDFDAFVIAGSVLFGRHQPYLQQFVREHAGRLNLFPSAFVSVCGALAGSWSRGKQEAEKYVSALLADSGWRPRLVLSVAGALPYTRYGFFTRIMMKAISAWTGRPTDTSRDWEFTDWDAVDLSTAEFAGLLQALPVEEAALDVKC
jgi:menaquinone-dependent protoporphyrinogen oxidase